MHDHQHGNNSIVHPHLQNCSKNNFTVSILSKEKDCVNAKLSEGIFIKKEKPKLKFVEEEDSLSHLQEELQEALKNPIP